MGAGLDVVEIDRLDRLRRRRPAFFERYFSADERERAERSARPAQIYARAFATKEAFLKAVGRGVLDGVPLVEVELAAGDRVRLGPRARAALPAAARVHVTVAADGARAWAMVLVG